MSTFPLLCVVRSKIWQKSGFLWKAKVDRTDVRNGVQIRKGKTGRVLFWFSVQTQQQLCDKDEMMWADEWRVIRSPKKLQQKSNTNLRWKYKSRDFFKKMIASICNSQPILVYHIQNTNENGKSSSQFPAELCNLTRRALHQKSNGLNTNSRKMCFNVACCNSILALVCFSLNIHYFQCLWTQLSGTSCCMIRDADA